MRTELAYENRAAGFKDSHTIKDLMSAGLKGENLYGISSIPHPMTYELELPHFMMCGLMEQDSDIEFPEFSPGREEWVTPVRHSPSLSNLKCASFKINPNPNTGS